MAATMSQMLVSTYNMVGGVTALSTPSASMKLIHGASGVMAMPTTATSMAGRVRGEARKGVRESIDEATKKDITEGEILTSMDTNESEQGSYFGAKPSLGPFTARAERWNGRLAMLEPGNRLAGGHGTGSPGTCLPLNHGMPSEGDRRWKEFLS